MADQRQPGNKTAIFRQMRRHCRSHVIAAQGALQPFPPCAKGFLSITGKAKIGNAVGAVELIPLRAKFAHIKAGKLTIAFMRKPPRVTIR